MSTQAAEKEQTELQITPPADAWSANIPVQVQNLTGSTMTNLYIFHLWQSGKVAELALTAKSINNDQTQPGGSINSGNGGYDNWIAFFYLDSSNVLQSTGVICAQVTQPNTGQFIQIQFQADGDVVFNVYGKDTIESWGPAYNEFLVVTS